MANTSLFSVLAPGGVLMLAGAALVRVSEPLALTLAGVGAVIFLGWPIFTLVTETRCAALRKRGLEIGSGLGRAQTLIARVHGITMLIVLPVAVFGGLGTYCLITAGADPEQRFGKIAIGIGSFALLGVVLLFLARGRKPLTLRLSGIALAIFGIGGLSLLVPELSVGIDSLGDAVMLIASILLLAAGLWLAVTGRNSLRRS